MSVLNESNVFKPARITRFQNARILVVDDDKTIGMILLEFLGELKAICEYTSSSQEAAKRMRENEYDVVLTDIYMPGMTGHDLLTISLECLPNTPVILMTGRPTLENSIDAIRLGAYDYLMKPFNLEAVQLTLERALTYRSLKVENLCYQNHLEQEVQKRTRQLADFLFHSVQSLTHALEARDPYTQGHGERVGKVVIHLARELGLDESHDEALRLASELHDIGKIGVPDSILLNPGKLSPTEYDIMKDHVFIGYKILSPIPSLKEVSRYVHEHHERIDGKGYPQGLIGDEIHFNSRILCVAEVLDALATERCYKPAWPLPDIVNYFEELSGIAYDQDVTKALMAILRREGDGFLRLFTD